MNAGTWEFPFPSLQFWTYWYFLFWQSFTTAVQSNQDSCSFHVAKVRSGISMRRTHIFHLCPHMVYITLLYDCVTWFFWTKSVETWNVGAAAREPIWAAQGCSGNILQHVKNCRKKYYLKKCFCNYKKSILLHLWSSEALCGGNSCSHTLFGPCSV